MLPLLVGCAGWQQYREGEQLLEAGDSDAAMARMREAVAKDPTNTQYQMGLSDAETVAAEQHLQKAQVLLAENRAAEGREELNRALELMPGHPQVVTMLAQLDAGMDAVTVASAHGASTAKSVKEPPQPSLAASTKPAEPAPAVAMRTTEEPPMTAKPTVQPVRKRPAREPVEVAAPTPAPVAPQPSEASAVPPPPEIQQTFHGTLSRDDDRYPKELATVDGIIIKLKDTGSRPIHADVEVRVGKQVKKYKDLRVGSRINGRGVSLQTYQLAITAIDTRTETIRFAIVPLLRTRP